MFQVLLAEGTCAQEDSDSQDPQPLESKPDSDSDDSNDRHVEQDYWSHHHLSEAGQIISDSDSDLMAQAFMFY